MEEVHCDSEQVPDIREAVVIEKKEFVAPAVRMEFEIYYDAYN